MLAGNADNWLVASEDRDVFNAASCDKLLTDLGQDSLAQTCVKPAPGIQMVQMESIMIELVYSNDLLYLNWLVSLLGSAEISAQILDEHVSVVEGSIGAIPRRLVVADHDAKTALACLEAYEVRL